MNPNKKINCLTALLQTTTKCKKELDAMCKVHQNWSTQDATCTHTVTFGMLFGHKISCV